MAATAYISLGSNLGSREKNIREAISRLREHGEVTKVSSFYETAPVEFTAQPWFLNAVLELETEQSPQELLRSLLAIEKSLGRDRSTAPPKGPRIIDLDILLYGGEVVRDRGAAGEALTIPHPAMHQRRFVLEPLAEIAPNAFHPVFKRSASDLLAELPANTGDVRRLP